MSAGATAAAVAGSAAATTTSQAAAQSAAALVSFDLTSLEKVFQVKKPYWIADDGEVRVWSNFVDFEVEKKGWFGTKKEKTFRSVYDSLPEAIRKYCPEGCAFLAFTLDWHHSQIRIYYGKPSFTSE